MNRNRSQDKDTDKTSKKIETKEPLQVGPTKNINLDTAVTFDREPLGLTPPQDPNISKLEIAKARIRDSINDARDLLAKIMTATLHPAPISKHVKDIAMMTPLAYIVDAYLMDTQPTCRDLNDMEIRDFSTSMIEICHRAPCS